MSGGGPRGGAPERIAYDGDQKLLAFLGAVAFVFAFVFWVLLGLRLLLSGAGGAAAAALCGATLCALLFLLAWGLRSKMQHGVALTRWEVRRLLAAGLLLGLGLGGLPYLVLRFKLEDPDFIHLASQPENLPPAMR